MQSKTGGASWKLALAALVLLFVVAQVGSMLFAGRRVSAVVDTDYYRKGLHYGETLHQAQNGPTDWSLAASLSGDRLQVTVTERTGQPVNNARVSLELPSATAAPAVSHPLAETSPGRYQAVGLAVPETGLRGTVRVKRGETVFSRPLVLLR